MKSIDIANGKLWTDPDDAILSVPSDFIKAFYPATHCLYEWTEYWFEHPDADQLRVHDDFLKPVTGHLFRLRFENQIGLTQIQPFAGSMPLAPLQHLEILSPKFPTPQRHLDFFRSLLDDLFARAARLPFTFNAPTGRAVAESMRPPTPLFIYHLLCQHAVTLRNALAIVESAPHRQLTDRSEWLSIANASEADADVLIEILHAPHELTRADGFALAERLGKRAPARVWQRRIEETFDTPENRFVLSFLRQLLIAAESLPSETWWSNVPSNRQQIIRDSIILLRQATHLSIFDDVGAMIRLPSTSQVLLRRDGYRELHALWQLVQNARRPLFEPIHDAIDVRNIAQLYEMWVLLALTEKIGSIFDQPATIDLKLSDESGVGWLAESNFGTAGKLIYNQDQQARSYSLPLRPDFSWIRNGDLDIVLDAKFRLTHFVTEEGEDSIESQAQKADLYKMHSYRDALGVRAAITIYPGSTSIFYDRFQGRRSNYDLRDVLTSEMNGIGAIGMSPLELQAGR